MAVTALGVLFLLAVVLAMAAAVINRGPLRLMSVGLVLLALGNSINWLTDSDSMSLAVAVVGLMVLGIALTANGWMRTRRLRQR